VIPEANPDNRKGNKMNTQMRLGDLRSLMCELPDNSIDLVLTDPPYGKTFRPLWSDAAEQAARVLKPGGFFVSYSGNHGLPDVMSRISQHLDYYWLAIVVHQSCPRRDEVRVVNAAKPVLVFNKSPRCMPEEWFLDVIPGSGAEKALHPWQQALGESRRLVRTFSKPGDLVLDPFAGTGTNLLAARLEGRRGLGFEISPRTFQVARARLGVTAG